MPNIPNPDKHFANLIKLYSVSDVFPDSDVILSKAGIGISHLRNLLNDSQVETVWNTRLAGVVGVGHSIEPGGTTPTALAAADFITKMVHSYDFPSIINGLMEAVAFGYCPVEIIWDTSGRQWRAADFVPKPPEWFYFSGTKSLMFRSRTIFSGIQVPDNKFIIIQSRPSYHNPYGVKLFSKVYWPVTFKRNGLRWWVTFLEKFGSPFIYGKFQKGASEQDKTDLLEALEDMISNSVAVGPDDSYVEIKGDMIKSQSGQVHEAFYNAQNAEIAKAILGQTLTSDIGDKGSRAAAEVHYQVKKDIALADQRLVAEGFNKLFSLVTRFNFGSDVPAPRFVFDQMEELHKERAERDKILYELGARFNAEYLAAQYQIDPSHLEMENDQSFSSSFLKSIRQFSRRKNNEMVDDFTARLEKSGQKIIDDLIDEFQDEIDRSKTVQDAAKRILNRHQKQFKHRSNLAEILDNMRYVAASSGASNAKK